MKPHHRNLLVALAVALVVTILLSAGHRQVGYVRDEGAYFEAGEHYAAWWVGPAALTDRRARDRAFRHNAEHPALLKTAAGLSARLLARPVRGETRGGLLPVLSEGAAMRLPAQLIAGLGVGLLFLAGLAVGGPWGGVMAAGWFILLPRVWFHAGLLAFDVPIAMAIFASVLVYRRGLRDWRYALAFGPVLGVAISIKHNALFLGPLLGAHYYFSLLHGRIKHGYPLRRGQILPLPLLSGLVLAPLTAVGLWPWLWSDPVGRIHNYFRFHLEHQWYNMELLGTNYNVPPLPASYPWIMTWATVPTVLLVLAVIGLAQQVRSDLRQRRDEVSPGSFRTALPQGWNGHDGILWTLMGIFPLALISLPTIPIFGGTKHWITAYPFLALAAARAFDELTRDRVSPAVRPLALALALAPGAIGTLAGHPFGLSQYAPLVGGPRGAADLGLNRGFWGHSVRPLLHELPAGGNIYIHDLHERIRQQYEREGDWPPGLASTPISRSTSGLIFHELHMTTYEVQLWNQLGTATPAMVVDLHDVPLTTYVAPRSGGG